MKGILITLALLTVACSGKSGDKGAGAPGAQTGDAPMESTPPDMTAAVDRTPPVTVPMTPPPKGVTLLEESKKLLEDGLRRLEHTQKILKENYRKASEVIMKNLKEFEKNSTVAKKLKVQLGKLKKKLDVALKKNEEAIKAMQEKIRKMEEKIKHWMTPDPRGGGSMRQPPASDLSSKGKPGAPLPVMTILVAPR